VYLTLDQENTHLWNYIPSLVISLGYNDMYVLPCPRNMQILIKLHIRCVLFHLQVCFINYQAKNLLIQELVQEVNGLRAGLESEVWTSCGSERGSSWSSVSGGGNCTPGKSACGRSTSTPSTSYPSTASSSSSTTSSPWFHCPNN